MVEETFIIGELLANNVQIFIVMVFSFIIIKSIIKTISKTINKDKEDLNESDDSDLNEDTEKNNFSLEDMY